ncbi:MAG: M60 family metallopeptidase [Prevotella sp.]|jgi:hypothetical protein|nr:M60 family metallopeptidase [Prevotella sp.]
MKKITYIILAACFIACLGGCEDKDYEMMESSTDDYIGESGGDYYEGDGIDVSMYAKARIFPGLVDTAVEKRLDEKILYLDLTHRNVAASDVNMVALPPAIYSSGLYAGAGEKITVVLDEDIKGLSIQIGIHSRDLTSLNITDRDPKVVAIMPLFQGKNEIRNPYGGYIWIRRSGTDGSNRNALPLKIYGAYEAADYIQGEMQPNEWVEKIRTTTVPWIELRGKNYAFSVPTEYIKAKVNGSGAAFATQCEQALKLWDDWMQCIYEFYGLDDTDPAFPMPDYPARAIMDVRLLNQRYSYYNNNITELLGTEELIDLITTPDAIKKGELNTVHIMGWLQLNMLAQVNKATSVGTLPRGFSDIYTLLPNFYFLYKNNWWNGDNRIVQQYKVGGTQVMMQGNSYELTGSNMDKLVSYASADTCKLYYPDAAVVESNAYVNAAFAVFADIISYQQTTPEGKTINGWTFLGEYNRQIAKAVNLSSNQQPNRTGMVNGLLSTMTTYFNRDFTSLFDRWGLEISDQARETAVDKVHIEKKIWKHNLLTKDPVDDYNGEVFYTASGKNPLRHIRTAWRTSAYSGTGASLLSYNWKEGQSPFNLFDGDSNTLWESDYDAYKDYTDEAGMQHYAYHTDSLYYKATTPGYPYTVVISPGASGLSKADGFYFAFGNTNEASIYNADISDFDFWNYHPQHVIVEVTSSPLEYNENDSIFDNIATLPWTPVYDSNHDSYLQFKRERNNLFFIDFASAQTNIRGIRLIFDRDSHTAKDRPSWFPEAEKPKRPEFANRYLNRIQKVGEFGTYYYK